MKIEDRNNLGSEYRLGLPAIEQVRAHEARGGWWMGRYPEMHPLPPLIGRFQFDREMRFTHIRYITDSPSSVLEYRPCLPDGTPCPWPSNDIAEERADWRYVPKCLCKEIHPDDRPCVVCEARGTTSVEADSPNEADLRIKIKLLRPNVRIPAYQTEGAAGLDLHCPDPCVISPREIRKVGIGIAISIPLGYEGQVRPRSGLATKGLVVLGTIDSDYRGEIAVTLINLGDKAIPFHAGDRIAQLVIAPIPRVRLEQVEALDETVRGDKGHGSTGR